MGWEAVLVGLSGEPGELVVLFCVDEPGGVRDVNGHIFLDDVVLDGDAQELKQRFEVGMSGKDTATSSGVWEERSVALG